MSRVCDRLGEEDASARGLGVSRGVSGGVWVAAVPRGRTLHYLREVAEVTEAVEVPFSAPAEVPVTVRLKTRR